MLSMRFLMRLPAWVLCGLVCAVLAVPAGAQTTRQPERGTSASPSGRIAQGPSQGPVRNNPAPQPPFPPLPEDHQKYLDEILRYWEQSSSDTKRYQCNFERWEYEPVFGPRNTYKTFSMGVIK